LPDKQLHLRPKQQYLETQSTVVLEGLFHFDLTIEWLKKGMPLAVALGVENETGPLHEIFYTTELVTLATSIHIQKILENSVDKISKFHCLLL